MKRFQRQTTIFQVLSPLTEGRGLKLRGSRDMRSTKNVAPHGGAWIETFQSLIFDFWQIVAPHGGAWIETKKSVLTVQKSQSRPSRRGVD